MVFVITCEIWALTVLLLSAALVYVIALIRGMHGIRVKQSFSGVDAKRGIVDPINSSLRIRGGELRHRIYSRIAARIMRHIRANPRRYDKIVAICGPKLAVRKERFARWASDEKGWSKVHPLLRLAYIQPDRVIVYVLSKEDDHVKRPTLSKHFAYGHPSGYFGYQEVEKGHPTDVECQIHFRQFYPLLLLWYRLLFNYQLWLLRLRGRRLQNQSRESTRRLLAGFVEEVSPGEFKDLGHFTE
jgi:hypothetical protein